MDFTKINVDWTFPDANTQYGTHGLHKYPARMPPQIPDTIIKNLKENGELNSDDIIYDPFLGSGTTLVEARRNGFDAVGNDINPFACMLSKAKSTPVNPDILDSSWDSYNDIIKDKIKEIGTKYHSDKDVGIKVENIRDGWFPEKQLYQLGGIRNTIDTIEDNYNSDISRIFRIALAETAREISYQRNGEFKRYRMAEEDRKEHNPDVWEIFEKSMIDKIPRIKSFYSECNLENKTDIFYADSRNITQLDANSINLIITSPPYGDHRTTVAYGQFSQDPGIISNKLGYDEMKQVDKNGLGGINNYESLNELEGVSDSLSQTIRTLENKDGRNEDAINFFIDYYQVMKECYRVLKEDSYIVWVVANRTMSRVNIPTHLITKELCENIGFTFESNIPREIPNRTMPLKNAPENISGHDGELMSNENIIVMKK